MKIIQEHVSLSEAQPFLISIFENEEINLNYPFHHHRHAYELTLTLGIAGTRMVGDSTAQFAGVDVVLMAPNLPHCWQDHGIRSTPNQKILVIQFSDWLIPTSIRQFECYQSIQAALQQAQYGLELIGAAKRKTETLLAAINAKDSFENYLHLLKLLNLFGDSSQTRRLCSEGYAQPSLNGESHRLKRVLQYIQENYSRKLPIEEVASQIHLSPSAFSHYFKKRTLKSFTQFVMELRLGKAAQLLQFTEMPIISVSYECGFQNLSHFNRSFHKRYKLPPLKFRKQMMEEVSPINSI